jgi:hypothetical protein
MVPHYDDNIDIAVRNRSVVRQFADNQPTEKLPKPYLGQSCAQSQLPGILGRKDLIRLGSEALDQINQLSPSDCGCGCGTSKDGPGWLRLEFPLPAVHILG